MDGFVDKPCTSSQFFHEVGNQGVMKRTSVFSCDRERRVMLLRGIGGMLPRPSEPTS